MGLAPPLLLVVPAALVSAAALVPIGYLLVRSSAGGMSGIVDVLLRQRTLQLLLRSLGLTVSVTVAATVLGVSLAWLTVRARLPARGLWQVLCVLPLAIPTYVAGFSYIAQFPQLAGFRGAWLVLTLYTYPYVYLPVSAALRNLDASPAEVARSLGQGPWQTFFRVTLKQLRPAVATGALLVALYALSDFGAVSLMRFTALTRAIYTSYQASFDRTPAAVLGTLLVAVTLVVVAAEGRSRGRARFDPAGRGASRRSADVDLGRATWPAFAGLVVVAVAALGVPAYSLTRWLTAGESTGATTVQTWTAALSSLGVSLAGSAATVLAALPVALLAARYRTRLVHWLERAAYVGHALPGVVIALSLVFLGSQYLRPLYQRVPLLVLAYVVLFLPLAVASIFATASQASPAIEDAARSLGSSPLGVLRRVTIPLVAPGVGAGAALVFLTCMKELPATLLLRPTGMNTLATRVWTETAAGSFAGAAPAAALLVLVAAFPTYLLTRQRGELPL